MFCVFHSIISFHIYFICISVSQIPNKDGKAIRQKGRTLRMSDEHLDSDCSQNEERNGLGEEIGSVRNAVRLRGNRNKSAVRFPEDSDIGYNSKRKRKGRYSEDDDYVAYENVDPLMQNETRIVKRNSRGSAQEAAKTLEKNFDVSPGDEEVVLG